MMAYVFIHGLTGSIFKILPLKESHDNGVDVHLSSYVHSLFNETMTACTTFPELSQYQEYARIVNTLSFLDCNDYDHATCKREVFKMLSMLNAIEKKLGNVATNGGEAHV